VSKDSANGGRLPVDLTSFVGRRGELAEVRRRLQDARLVTLTGIGGVGKTRLALRAAALARRAFKDSVWMVELGELRDPELVPTSVATALQVVHRTSRPIQEVLQEHLASRRLLLVIDNCEHLLDATAELTATLLRSSPQLKVLATSREPLNIDGESVVRVPPLTVPSLDERATNAGFGTTSEAVTLFVERARSHAPEFELTAENRGTVVEICRHLEGLPLPIELAAARMRTLSTTQILEHLNDRFSLLTAGRRAAPSRQQTLLSSVSWSRDLCSPDEQCLWARLSVFAGGAELDAIDGVCSGAPISTDILDLLGNLVDKSIVIRDQPSSNARYKMLETLREYGRGQLSSSGEYSKTRRRHRDWFAQLVDLAANDWVSGRAEMWAARMDREQANLREAMDYSFSEPAEAMSGLRIATALYPFWLTCGHYSEGRRWLHHAVDAPQVYPSLRATALLHESVLAGLEGDTESASSLLAQGRAILGDSDDPSALASLEYANGYVALYGGNTADAALHFNAASILLRNNANRFLQCGSLIGLGLCHIADGRVDEARACCHEALDMTEAGDIAILQTHSMWILGIALWLQTDSDQAIDMLGRALTLSRRTDPLATAWCLEVLAWVAADNNLERRASTLIGAADAIWRQLGGGTLISFPGMEKFHRQSESRILKVLGPKSYEGERSRGAAMSLDNAVAYALNETSIKEQTTAGQPEELTSREREVAQLIAQGMTNKAIAEALVVSQRTAQGHVGSILRKLNFTSRAQIAAWFVELHSGEHRA
jgi:predicted ATPase/DNA-binding CsgD family transcriptional regulator